MKRDILYPCFLRVLTTIDDYYWKNIFENMAYGVCPYGTFIHQGTLYCNIKEKQISYHFASKPDADIRDTLLHYFRTKLSIGTLSEFMAVRTAMENTLLLSNYTSWKDIRKKNIQTILLINYALHVGKKHNLNINQVQQLFKDICTGFTFKWIDKDDVVYDPTSCSILHINRFKECKRSFQNEPKTNNHLHSKRSR